jgi:hypothetical protein
MGLETAAYVKVQNRSCRSSNRGAAVLIRRSQRWQGQNAYDRSHNTRPMQTTITKAKPY